MPCRLRPSCAAPPMTSSTLVRPSSRKARSAVRFGLLRCRAAVLQPKQHQRGEPDLSIHRRCQRRHPGDDRNRAQLDAEALIAMKAARKRRSGHPRRSDASPAPPRSSAMKFPIQAPPVICAVMRDPIRISIAASDSNCAERCLAACRLLSGPPQSVCESLCRTICNR